MELGIVAPNRHAFELVRRAVFAHYSPGGISIGGIPQSPRDTAFEYYLTLDRKLTRGELARLQSFILGIIAASKC